MQIHRLILKINVKTRSMHITRRTKKTSTTLSPKSSSIHLVTSLLKTDLRRSRIQKKCNLNKLIITKFNSPLIPNLWRPNYRWTRPQDSRIFLFFVNRTKTLTLRGYTSSNSRCSLISRNNCYLNSNIKKINLLLTTLTIKSKNLKYKTLLRILLSNSLLSSNSPRTIKSNKVVLRLWPGTLTSKIVAFSNKAKAPTLHQIDNNNSLSRIPMCTRKWKTPPINLPRIISDLPVWSNMKRRRKGLSKIVTKNKVVLSTRMKLHLLKLQMESGNHTDKTQIQIVPITSKVLGQLPILIESLITLLPIKE
jgi:hypothetical protein